MGKWYNGAQITRGTMNKAAEYLDDREASTCPTLYRKMQYDGKLIAAGTRINWNGEVKKAAVDLWDTKENTPDAVPTLWSDIDYKDGIRIIPDVIPADLAFSKGELGWRNDVIYESLINANVWTPEEYSAGWKVAE